MDHVEVALSLALEKVKLHGMWQLYPRQIEESVGCAPVSHPVSSLVLQSKQKSLSLLLLFFNRQLHPLLCHHATTLLLSSTIRTSCPLLVFHRNGLLALIASLRRLNRFFGLSCLLPP